MGSKKSDLNVVIIPPIAASLSVAHAAVEAV
jgi:hypothetical protein